MKITLLNESGQSATCDFLCSSLRLHLFTDLWMIKSINTKKKTFISWQTERESALYHHRMVIVQSLPLFSLISGRSDHSNNLSLALSVCWSSESELYLSILQLLRAKSGTSIKDKTNPGPKPCWGETRCQLQASPGYIRNNPLRSLSRFHPDPLRWGLISTWHM